MSQLDLFNKSLLSCECLKRHSLDEYDYKKQIKAAGIIAQIILDTGWDLTETYYLYSDKLDRCTTAWKIDENAPYLRMRSHYHEDLHKISIPLQRYR